MGDSARSAGKDDGRLWALALALALVVNVGLIAALGLAALESERTRAARPALPPPPAPLETAVLVLQMPEAAPAVPEQVEENPASKFARTSADQAAPPPNRPTFIGERDTQATSDRAPDPTALPMPSQAGEKPRDENDFETTESDFRDGSPAADTPAPAPLPQEIARPTPPAEATAAQAEQAEQAASPPEAKPRVKLATSSSPVDVAVPKVDAPARDRPELPKEKPAPEQKVAKAATAPPVRDPAFAGNQRKKAIIGSISRSGRSALDVADTPLGRYQAAVSKAVELEWQRNCVRHRDFITPGYLTVRFYVQPNGHVKTVRFVGEMETGEVQKGFTLSSIRDAKIPAMPASLRKEFEDSTLELLFNFYF